MCLKGGKFDTYQKRCIQHFGRSGGSLFGAREAALGMQCGLLSSQYKKGTDLEKHSVTEGPEPVMCEEGKTGVSSVWRRKGQAAIQHCRGRDREGNAVFHQMCGESL